MPCQAAQLWRSRFAARAGERGAAAVEFALVLLPLLFILLGTLQYGWYFYTAQSTSSAARELTRRIVVGDCPTQAEQQTYVQSHANANAITVDPITIPAVGQTVTVRVSADGTIIGFVPMPSGPVVREVKARMEDLTASSPCT